MNNADKPASPATGLSKYSGGRFGDKDQTEYSDGTGKIFFPGLTKREYFAAMAMQGILSSSADRGESYVATQSVKFADELLKQLEQ
jgi:hypothetical protein